LLVVPADLEERVGPAAAAAMLRHELAHVALGLNSPRDTDPRTHVRALGYAGEML